MLLKELIARLAPEQVSIFATKKAPAPVDIPRESPLPEELAYLGEGALVEREGFLPALVALILPGVPLDEVKRKMSRDIDEKGLFQRFNYQKDRTMRKGDIQRALLSNGGVEEEDNNQMRKFIADYFSINVIILPQETMVLSTDDSLEPNFYKPTYLLYENEGEGIRGILLPSPGYLLYPASDFLKGIFDKLTEEAPADIPRITKGMKLKEVQDIAERFGISLKKPSERTSNMIRKSRTELVEELDKLRGGGP